jgi:hypothetical protein
MMIAAGTSLVRRVGVVVASASALALLVPSAAQAAPTNVTPPTVSGALEVEHALTASTGTWTDAASPIVSYAYQWLRCNASVCTDIDYATANPYTLPWSFAGSQAEVTVTATDAQGESSFATSSMTNVIANGPSYTLGESSVGAGSVTGFETGPEATSHTADANLSCPGACGARYTYLPGTRIELIAMPAAGATFLGWGGACSGSAPACSLVLGGDVAAVATFTGAATTPPEPALGSGGEPREAPASGSAGALVPEAMKTLASSTAGPPARLLSIRGLHHGVQAVVRCQEARPCRLSLALVAGTRGGYVIAQRSFTIAGGRSAHISLALSQAGERLLAERRRLPVTARLTLGVSGRAITCVLGRLTLTLHGASSS